MERRDIIVVGASAGGVAALKLFVSTLPKDFRGSVFIVLHIPAYTESRLPTILSLAGPLEAVHPEDGEEIKPGKIYVAPSDYHMLLAEKKILIKRGPKENRFRPSIDALFRSAAYMYKKRVIGIILSGVLNDGASGLWSVKQQGGLIMIQTPEEAEQPQLPINVLEYVEADYVLSAVDMGPIVAGMLQEKPGNTEKNKLSEEELNRLKMEVVIAATDNAFEMGIMDMGELTPFTCPECHGALVRLVEGNILRFRCHTGHAYTASSLLAELTESIESRLWQTIRGLEEVNMLMRNIGDQFEKMDNTETAALFRKKAEEAAGRARALHKTVFQQEQYSEDMSLDKEDKA